MATNPDTRNEKGREDSKRLDRRSFLTTSAGLTAAVAAPSILSALEKSDTIRVAVVGTGGRGGNHVLGFGGIDGCEVSAISDPDSSRMADRAGKLEKKTGKAPRKEQDFRKLLDDKSIDAIVIATPDHWHAPAAIWACQAGKDVYVEKPCAHTVTEAKLLYDAARKYDRVVQHGTQSRSAEHIREGIEFVQSGQLGPIHQIKVVNSQVRSNIGHKKDAPVPDGVDYDIWLGPAPERAFNPNRFHYNWHWHWDYGTGDMGNDGCHQLDLAYWAMGDPDLPKSITAGGGKFFFDDDQETPDTQTVIFEFPNLTFIYDMRLWSPYPEQGTDQGAIFYGEKGYMVMDRARDWQVYWKGDKKGPRGEPKSNRGVDHRVNFLNCMRSRKRPVADIGVGYKSSSMAALGNLALRLKRHLTFDEKAMAIVGDDEATAMLSKTYRKGYEVSDAV